MAGKDVLALQKTLKVKGYDPGILDGKYGTATSHAVSLFQKAHGLHVDGIYGPATAARLAAPVTKQPAAQSKLSKGSRALTEALKHLGVHESPVGSNHNPFGAWMGINGVPWCNEFVSYCFNIGAGVVLCRGSRGAGVTSKGCTYVPTTEAWLRSSGQWVGRVAPLPGDIAVFNWDGGVPDHIGIVEKYLGGGKFLSIEGNTAVGNDSNGGEVMRRERVLGQVDGFGRIR
jgi:hypothetical protein